MVSMKTSKAAKETRLPVSTRALIARINRKLAKRDEKLLTIRGKWRLSEGSYAIINVRFNRHISSHVNLENTGRTEGVLQPYEFLAE
jgi:hypothetical protein